MHAVPCRCGASGDAGGDAKSAATVGKEDATTKPAGLRVPRSHRRVRYALSHWDELGKFLEDARIPLDNNASERALRRVALGRKNYLFVGDVDAGRNIAGLYSLVATCEARGINPFAYLADILPRISDHPNSRIDELLPGAWQAAQA